MEPHVLQEQHLARLQPRDRGLGLRADAVRDEGHLAPEMCRELASDRSKRKLRVRTGGASKVRHDDHRGSAMHEIPQRRYRGLDAGVVRDLAVGHRDVEVFADENPLARDVDRCDRELPSRAAMWAVTSTMRKLKP